MWGGDRRKSWWGKKKEKAVGKGRRRRVGRTLVSSCPAFPESLASFCPVTIDKYNQLPP